ncbi:hypothetical protein ABES21_19860, partial [Peribacillus frigoritolerans]|uniref:hypothetical protein n=1 Tax=Peribacillus frigoritolerans TaxID=450367 RepID=UPI003D28B0FC
GLADSRRKGRGFLKSNWKKFRHFLHNDISITLRNTPSDPIVQRYFHVQAFEVDFVRAYHEEQL